MDLSKKIRKLIRQKNDVLNNLKTNIGRTIFNKKNTNKFDSAAVSEIKNIAYLRHDNKIGDMIVATLAFREIKKAFPNAKLHLIAGRDTEQIVEDNPNIDNIYIYHNGLLNIYRLGKKIKQKHIDLYIDMDKETKWQILFLLRLISPKYALGFNREKDNLYNVNIPFDFDNYHKILHHEKIFEILGVKNIDTRYDIFIPQNCSDSVSAFMHSLPANRKNIVLNPFAASKHKWLSLKQIIGIANTLKDINSNFNIILVGTQQDRSVLLANQELPDNVFLPTFSDYNIFHSFELIKRSDFVITTDTSILHATVAFNKPLVGLYLGGEQQNEVAIWGPGPNSINHQIIFSGGPLIDVGEIEIDKIVKSLLDLQNSVK